MTEYDYDAITVIIDGAFWDEDPPVDVDDEADDEADDEDDDEDDEERDDEDDREEAADAWVDDFFEYPHLDYDY